MIREQVLLILIKFDSFFSRECRDKAIDVDLISLLPPLLLLRGMEIIRTRIIVMMDLRMIIMECICNPQVMPHFYCFPILGYMTIRI